MLMAVALGSLEILVLNLAERMSELVKQIVVVHLMKRLALVHETKARVSHKTTLTEVVVHGQITHNHVRHTTEMSLHVHRQQAVRGILLIARLLMIIILAVLVRVVVRHHRQKIVQRMMELTNELAKLLQAVLGMLAIILAQ